MNCYTGGRFLLLQQAGTNRAYINGPKASWCREAISAGLPDWAGNMAQSGNPGPHCSTQLSLQPRSLTVDPVNMCVTSRHPPAWTPLIRFRHQMN